MKHAKAWAGVALGLLAPALGWTHGYQAQFGSGILSQPADVAMDGSGNTWVGDCATQRVYKFNGLGQVLLTLSGFSNPHALAFDYAAQVLYVADEGAHQIFKFDANGSPLLTLGTGTWGTGEFDFYAPRGIAVHPDGSVIVVADTGNHRLVVYQNNGTFVRSIGMSGTVAGQFNSPQGVDVDLNGAIFAVDAGNGRVQQFQLSGSLIRNWGSPGTNPGQLNQPAGIVVSPAGDVYVSDQHRIQRFSYVGNYLGGWGALASGSGNGQMSTPMGLATDLEANILVADYGNGRVQGFTSDLGEQVGAALMVAPPSGEAGTTVVFSVTGVTGQEGVLLTLFGDVDAYGFGGDPGPSPASGMVSGGVLGLTVSADGGWSQGAHRFVLRNDAAAYRSATVMFTMIGGGGGSFQISGAVRNSLYLGVPGVAVVVSSTVSITSFTNGAGEYSATGLAGGVTYVVTPYAEGMVFDPTARTFANLNASQSNQDFTVGGGGGPNGGGQPTGGASRGTDGLGAATLSPADAVDVNSAGTWTLVYTVPQEQLLGGGGVRFDIPSGWSAPQAVTGATAGFVKITNSASVNQSVKITELYGQQSVYVQFAVTLAAGTTVTLVYGSPDQGASGRAQAPAFSGSYNFFRVSSDLDGVENGFEPGFKSFQEVYVYPPLNIVVIGPPAGVRFSASQQAGLKGTLQTVVLETSDQSGGKAGAAEAPIFITLEAQAVDSENKIPTGQARTSLTLYTDAAGSAIVSGAVMITTGASALTLYYRDAESGLARLQAAADISLAEYVSHVEPFLDIVTMDAGIARVSIDTGTSGALTRVTLTPDGDGENDFAFVNFALEQESDWQVIVDSNRDGQFAESRNFNVAGDQAFYGRATDNRIQLEARDPHMWRPLPNGLYPVRIALGSWGPLPSGEWGFVPSTIVDATLSFVVSSAGLTGTVWDSQNNRVAKAQLNVGGASYGFAETDANGAFTIAGLKSGEVHVNVRKSGFAELNLEVTLAGTGETSLAVTLEKGAVLRVAAVRPTGSYPFEVWGGVEVHALNGMFGGYGPLHFAAGSGTLSDNGWYDPYDTGNFKNYSEIGLGLGTHGVQLHGISGLGVAAWTAGGLTLATTAKLSALQITEVVDLTLTVYLDRRPGIQGVVTLTEAGFYQGYGQWVGVWASPAGDPSDWEHSAYGGVYLPSGTGTAAFELPGVGDGRYEVRARAEGFVEYLHPVMVTISGQTVSPASLTIQEFSRGASITGLFVIPGNTLTQNIWLNAFSPSGFGGASVELTGASAAYIIGGLAPGTYDINTFLPGYEMEKFANGARSVTIASSGIQTVTQDITLKAFSGAISGEVRFPAGDASPAYQGVRVFVNQLFGGPEFGGGHGGDFLSNSNTLTFANGKYTFEASGLGTGGYSVSTIFQFDPSNPTKFYTSKNKVMRVENGQRTSVVIELGDQVFDVRGTVTTKSASARWSTIAKITANASRETIYGSSGPEPGPSMFRVVALPVNEMGEGGGLGKGFGAGGAGGLGFFGVVRPGTLDATVGDFLIPKLAPGAYKLFVPGQLSLATGGPGGGGPGGGGPGGVTPDLVSTEQLIVVREAEVSDAHLEISDGYKVGGTVSIPSAESQLFVAFVNIFQPRNSGFFRGVELTITAGSTSKTFSFEKLAPGTYTVQVFSEKYTQGAKSVEVVSSDVTGVTIALAKGANIKGKLRDVDSNTLLTSQNAEQYLGGLQIYAQANPWVEGGWREAERTRSGGYQGGSYSLTSSGYFSINNVPAGTYDVVVRGQTSFDQSKTKNYAPRVIAGLVVSDDDATNTVSKDIGTIDLKRGESVKGRITDKATGTPLANIVVGAFPSNRGGYNASVSARSDAEGNYTLLGLDVDQQYFTIIASPRGMKFSSDMRFDAFMQDEEKYAESRKDDVDISVTANRTGVDFAIARANAAVSGKVYTVDGGVLQPGGPDSDKGELQIGAAVMLQDLAEFSADDPLGNIKVNTQADGSYFIDGLVPGTTYQGRVLAKGYATKRFQMAVATEGVSALPSLTLVKGGRISGTVLKSNGAKPNTTEVGGVVAVTADFSEILFGTGEVDSTTRLVSRYAVDGLTAGTSYNIIIFPQSEGRGAPDNMIDAGTVMLTAATEAKTVNIIYRPTGPTFISQFQKSGSSLVLKFFSTQALRNLTTDDKDATKLVMLKSGSGTLTAQAVSADRRLITARYTPGAGETTFTINLKAWSNAKDLSTNDYFVTNEDFQFFLGFDGQAVEQFSNVLGGELKIAGDQSKATFGQGAFNVGLTTKVKVEMYKVATTSGGAPKFAPGAYPVKSFARFAKAPVVSGVYSSYYDVFIKSGSLASGKTYALQLAYDASIADTSGLNVYYLDEATNSWKKEDTNRKVDAANRTISVQLNHASRFVVVNNSAATIGGTQYTGSEFTVFNYPNPFDLQAKTVTLSKAAGGGTATITGTEIRYTLPSTMTGDVTFTIYNLAGEKIRTLTESSKPGGYYYYVEWDGRNEQGSEVASGVYFCVAKAPGASKIFKMAVVK